VEDKRFIFIALIASTLTVVIPDTVFLLTFLLQFSARPIKTTVVKRRMGRCVVGKNGAM
jgi:hypothetical protein